MRNYLSGNGTRRCCLSLSLSPLSLSDHWKFSPKVLAHTLTFESQWFRAQLLKNISISEITRLVSVTSGFYRMALTQIHNDVHISQIAVCIKWHWRFSQPQKAAVHFIKRWSRTISNQLSECWEKIMIVLRKRHLHTSSLLFNQHQLHLCQVLL